jgi:hypothetical protein
VRLEEADGEKERLRDRLAEYLDGDRRHRVDMSAIDLDHAVVADHVGALGDVLLADEDRVVAGGPQRVDDVLAVVVQRPAAVGEPEHSVRVPVLPGQQARPRRRTRRRGAEGLAKKDPLVRETLYVRRRDGMPVGLHVAAGVMRVHVEDVGWAIHGQGARPGTRLLDSLQSLLD